MAQNIQILFVFIIVLLATVISAPFFSFSDTRDTEIVNPPDLTVGDEWEYVHKENKGRIKNRIVKIDRTGFYLLVRNDNLGKKTIIMLNSELNEIGDEKRFNFPLFVGKKWSEQKKVYYFFTVRMNFEVLEKDVREVPAGIFETMHLRAVFNVIGWSGVVDYWYSDCVGGVVEVETDFETDEITPRKLIDYSYKNAPAECRNKKT